MEVLKKISILSIAGIMFSCGGNNNSKDLDTPAKGDIIVAVDESFKPIIDAEKTAFMEMYKYTKINAVYKPENEAIADMLNDKARIAVVTRELNEKEKKIFTDQQISYRSYRIAADGIALITNKNNQDTLISVNDLEALMKGTKKKWSDIVQGGSGEDVVLVFDNINSSNLTFLMNKFGISTKAKIPIYAAKSNQEVIEYVKTHSNAIGVIGNNWVSDGDDPASLGFIRSINVMSVTEAKNPRKEDYYQPFGYNLALKKYPLRREIRGILKEAHMGLGTGFINYMCGDAGQLIALKGGLIPLTRPINIRPVQINN